MSKGQSPSVWLNTVINHSVCVAGEIQESSSTMNKINWEACGFSCLWMTVSVQLEVAKFSCKCILLLYVPN